MKIRLIYPSSLKQGQGASNKDIHLRFHPQMWFPLITFPILAAYTPEGAEIEITDEMIDDIDYDAPVDMVGLTCMTHTAPRAYEIAGEFRKRGVTTVIGGFHVSALPEEALEHVDCVVIGEGEESWPKAVNDFKRGNLQRIYRSQGLFNMEKYRTPRMDLLSKYCPSFQHYQPPYYPSLNIVEISRGCPFRCDYCAVANFYGSRHRLRPLESVFQEIRQHKLKSRDRFICFNDDNLFGSRSYFRELIKGLKPMNVEWSAQMSLDVARDPEMLRSMAEAGCRSIGIGIESISQESLSSVNKRTAKADEYDLLFRRVRDVGVKIFLSLMVGFDSDNESVFDRTMSWLMHHLDTVIYTNFHILTPLPGTVVYKRLNSEKRIFDFDWRHYDTKHLVFEPRGMTADALRNGFQRICAEMHDFNMSNWKRFYSG